jgi:transposase
MKVSTVNDIRQIILQTRAGVSQREIAQNVGVARNTVSGYQKLAKNRGWLDASVDAPNEKAIADALAQEHPPQSVSVLSEHKAWIEQRLQDGASTTKIMQELKEDKQVDRGYTAVWSYVQRLRGPAVDATVRVESSPGEEAQVDFGYAGWMLDPLTQKQRKAWAFVMTLSYSRHMFMRFVFDQSIETWLQCHRAAFEFFGGVPGRVRPDNLKAAIVRASNDDPVVQKAYREMAEHYGFMITPCRVATPQHKGKVEAGVKYVKGNFLSGQHARYTTPDRNITHANADARAWVLSTAGTRIHGTTRWQPLKQFMDIEKAQLRTLPETPYEIAFWTQAKVCRDCHFSLEANRYSAPWRLSGQTVDLRVSDREVQIYIGHERIATHSRLKDKGQISTDVAHLPEYKLLGMQSRPVLSETAAKIGPYTAMITEQLLSDGVVDKTRTVQRLIGLANKHDKALLERACKAAVECGDLSPQTVRNMLKLVMTGHTEAPLPDTPPAPATFARSIDELAPPHALASFAADNTLDIIEPERYRAHTAQEQA